MAQDPNFQAKAAVVMAELVALDDAAKAQGSSLIDLLAVVGKNAFGVDIRPTPEAVAAEEPAAA
jgi:hypothetical protein